MRRSPEGRARLVRRAPSPGALRRERRAIVRAREEMIRDLGGLMLEMYRRDQLREDLLLEHCREIVGLESRLHELDSMLSAATAGRHPRRHCECGAPIYWGSHFCANCGRPAGEDAVVACVQCGHPLPADAEFCPSCGRTVEAEKAEAVAEAAAERASDAEPEAEADATVVERPPVAATPAEPRPDTWEH
jgi:Double zinc ribbon